jgi:hypothetical protein
LHLQHNFIIVTKSLVKQARIETGIDSITLHSHLNFKIIQTGLALKCRYRCFTPALAAAGESKK